MIERFENLTIGVTQIYKSIQKIKRCSMDSLGLKGTHVMCLHYLSACPDGLTAADLCEKCKEDKAGISRILSDLEKHNLIAYLSSKREGDEGSTNTTQPKDTKRYRAKAVLTEKGRQYAKTVTNLIIRATIEGGQGITEKERDIFYDVLFRITDNLNHVCSRLDQNT